MIRGDMIRLVLRILREEMGAVAKDPRARIDPGKISPSACADFTFAELQQLYQEKCPTLWRVLRILGGMTELLEEEDAVDDFDVEANTVFNNGNADDNDQSDTAHNAIDSEDEELAEESEH